MNRLGVAEFENISFHREGQRIRIKCPYSIPGDRLWVREGWRVHFMYDDLPPRKINQKGWREGDGIQYRAGGQNKADISWGKWRNSIFMCRWASRILLEVVSVRVEPLQNISKKDALAEGIVRINKHYLMDPECLKIPVEYSNTTQLNDERYWGYDNAPGAFAAYFEEVNGDDAWDKNPWVWVVEFKILEPRENDN